MKVKCILYIITGCFLVIGCNQANNIEDIVNEMYPEEQTQIKNFVQEIWDTVKKF